MLSCSHSLIPPRVLMPGTGTRTMSAFGSCFLCVTQKACNMNKWLLMICCEHRMAAAKLQKHSLVELAAAVVQTVSPPWQRERHQQILLKERGYPFLPLIQGPCDHSTAILERIAAVSLLCISLPPCSRCAGQGFWLRGWVNRLLHSSWARALKLWICEPLRTLSPAFKSSKGVTYRSSVCFPTFFLLSHKSQPSPLQKTLQNQCM